MGKLLTDITSFVDSLDAPIDDINKNSSAFLLLYKTYVLSTVKDASYIKELMKEKIEKGLRSYDN